MKGDRIVVVADHLSPEEVEYHVVALRQFRSAQMILQFWISHLSEKYELSPLDRIEDDGRITRVSSEEVKKERYGALS
jgi:hypothetical protein